MKKGPINNFKEDIRKRRNIDVYITIFISAILAIMGFFTEIIDMKQVVSAILAVLSLEAIVVLQNRRDEEDIQQSLVHIKQAAYETKKDLSTSITKISQRLSRPYLRDVFIDFQEERQEISNCINKAQEVWILSRTCREIWRKDNKHLRELPNRKGLRLLFINPEKRALDIVVRTTEFRLPGDQDRTREDVTLFVERLRRFQLSENLSNFEVRLIDYLPAWTLIFINPNGRNGRIYVELATYHSNWDDRPTFMVERNKDGDLFYHFCNEYKKMWNDATHAWTRERDVEIVE